MGVLNDRIKIKRTEKGLTLAQVAEYLGVEEATAQRYESGKIKHISYDNIIKLSNLFHCSPTYLLGWDESKFNQFGQYEHNGLFYGSELIKMLQSAAEDVNISLDDACEIFNKAQYDDKFDTSPKQLNKENILKLLKYGIETDILNRIKYIKRIPVFGKISAEYLTWTEENVEGYEKIEDDRIDFALRVKGDSMIGARINNNDIVYVGRDCLIENGDLVLALINDEDAAVKRFYQHGDMIYLRPENPSMKEQVYRVQDVQILGKVISAKINLEKS